MRSLMLPRGNSSSCSKLRDVCLSVPPERNGKCANEKSIYGDIPSDTDLASGRAGASGVRSKVFISFRCACRVTLIIYTENQICP